MIYKRRFLQFNDLVFDTYNMLRTSSVSVEFKGETQPYGFGHGSYAPHKRDSMFISEGEVSLTLRFRMKKLPCEYREFYKPYAITELTKPGKLWAVVNNEIVWAYAHIVSLSDSDDAKKDEYIVNVDLVTPEGVWHKADKTTTFLVPYNVCTFMECKGYRKVDPCANFPSDGDCCTSCKNKKATTFEEDCCCCCTKITKDMALCYHTADLQDFYKMCIGTYQIVMNCEKGQEFFSDKFLGSKICTKDSCDGIIAGHFYSETELPTTGYEIVIDGAVHNPQISINGNKNIIKGDYDRLFISSNGDVYSETKNACCKKLLDPSVWVVPTTDDEYGWTIHQGENRLVIDRGSCCGRACAYIQMDNLTI